MAPVPVKGILVQGERNHEGRGQDNVSTRQGPSEISSKALAAEAEMGQHPPEGLRDPTLTDREAQASASRTLRQHASVAQADQSVRLCCCSCSKLTQGHCVLSSKGRKARVKDVCAQADGQDGHRQQTLGRRWLSVAQAPGTGADEPRRMGENRRHSQERLDLGDSGKPV